MRVRAVLDDRDSRVLADLQECIHIAHVAPQVHGDDRPRPVRDPASHVLWIQQQALSVGVGRIPATTIDIINILQATYLAMEQAIAALDVTPQYLLLDAVTLKNVPIR